MLCQKIRNPCCYHEWSLLLAPCFQRHCAVWSISIGTISGYEMRAASWRAELLVNPSMAGLPDKITVWPVGIATIPRPQACYMFCFGSPALCAQSSQRQAAVLLGQWFSRCNIYIDLWFGGSAYATPSWSSWNTLVSWKAQSVIGDISAKANPAAVLPVVEAAETVEETYQHAI